MTHALRSFLLGLIFLAIGGLSIAQAPKTEDAATKVADKAAADKAAADRAAAASSPLTLNNEPDLPEVFWQP